MTLEQSLSAIVSAEKQSGLSTADFYRALARVATMDHILRTALVRGTYTTTRPNPVEAPKFIEPLVAVSETDRSRALPPATASL